MIKMNITWSQDEEAWKQKVVNQKIKRDDYLKILNLICEKYRNTKKNCKVGQRYDKKKVQS